MSKTENQTTMAEVHARIKAAVARSVARTGLPEREAFDRHMCALAAGWPEVFRAYTAWLLFQAK